MAFPSCSALAHWKLQAEVHHQQENEIAHGLFRLVRLMIIRGVRRGKHATLSANLIFTIILA